MARTSKSPRAVALAALATARRALPEYAHRCSPKKFTQHQLFACLVLKNFLRADYRGLAEHLQDNPTLLATLEMKQVPHFTTFQKASHRLLQTKPARQLLEATVRSHLGRKRRVKRAAIDSTGLECSCASGYFIRRRKRAGDPWKTVVYHHYPKLGVVSGTDDHFIYAFQAGRGPRPDIDEFRPLLADALQWVRISQMAADAGYDSEPNHKFARDQHGIRTVIPPKHGRPTTKPATGRYRRLMQVRFDRPAYRRRSQVETVISMIKRRQSSHVSGRSYWSQCRDLRLLALTHNLLLLVLAWVFYRAAGCCLRHSWIYHRSPTLHRESTTQPAWICRIWPARSRISAVQTPGHKQSRPPTAQVARTTYSSPAAPERRRVVEIAKATSTAACVET